MSKKFENKKLNKRDHAKVDKDADIARTVVGGVGVLGMSYIIKKIPWKNVGGVIKKVVFKS